MQFSDLQEIEINDNHNKKLARCEVREMQHKPRIARRDVLKFSSPPRPLIIISRRLFSPGSSIS